MPTSEWSIETPTSLEFDDVTGLRVRLIAGSVAVLATTGKPTLEVSSIEGDPLNVSYEDGVLTVAHENLSWEGLLKWLRPQRHAATVTVSVPRKCAAQVGVVSGCASTTTRFFGSLTPGRQFTISDLESRWQARIGVRITY